VNWSRPTDSGSTENARLENRKLFKLLFKLLSLSFAATDRDIDRLLQQRRANAGNATLSAYVDAFSTVADSYLRFPYLRIPSSGTFVFRTCVFSRPDNLLDVYTAVAAAVPRWGRRHRPLQIVARPQI